MVTSDYEKELQNALLNLQRFLSEAQTSIGVISSMLYLIRKEKEKTAEPTQVNP